MKVSERFLLVLDVADRTDWADLLEEYEPDTEVRAVHSPFDEILLMSFTWL